MKLAFLLIASFGLLAGCGVSDFVAKQNQWNQQNGMGGMNAGPVMTSGPSASEQQDEETQRNIKRGEDVENEEAAKAGLGPSPTAGMNCATSSSSSGSLNNMTSTSHTNCHN